MCSGGCIDPPRLCRQGKGGVECSVNVNACQWRKSTYSLIHVPLSPVTRRQFIPCRKYAQQMMLVSFTAGNKPSTLWEGNAKNFDTAVATYKWLEFFRPVSKSLPAQRFGWSHCEHQMPNGWQTLVNKTNRSTVGSDKLRRNQEIPLVQTYYTRACIWDCDGWGRRPRHHPPVWHLE